MMTKDTIFNGKFDHHTCLNQGMILVLHTVVQFICSSNTITSHNVVNNRLQQMCVFAMRTANRVMQ